MKQAKLLNDGQLIIDTLEKRRVQLLEDSTITAPEQVKVSKLYQIIFIHVDRSQGTKKRAQGYLEQIYNHSRELFTLHGLVISHTFLAKNTHAAGLQRILAWWDSLKEVSGHPSVLGELSKSLLVRDESTIDEQPPTPNQTLERTLSLSIKTTQQDTEATSAVDSQLHSPPRSNAIQHNKAFANTLDSEPSKKRARTHSGLVANSVDIQSLQECRGIIQLLYPGRSTESLRSLTREQLISLLGFQDLPSHAFSPAERQSTPGQLISLLDSQGLPSHASPPAERQSTPGAEGLLSQAYPLEDRIGIPAQTSTSTSNPHSVNAGPATTNSSAIFYRNLSDDLPQDSLLSPDNSLILLPSSSIYNMQLSYLFDFLKYYKAGACTVAILYGEPYSAIDICYGGQEWDVRISVSKQVANGLLGSLNMRGPYSTGSFNLTCNGVFHFFQLVDPGPTLQLVTEWTDKRLLPSMEIPMGRVHMRSRIKMDLVTYIKEMGVALDYGEKFTKHTVPSDGAGYI